MDAGNGGADLMHLLAHWLGLDTQKSPFYNFWSGIASQASVVVAYLALRVEIRNLRDAERWHDENEKEHEDEQLD